MGGPVGKLTFVPGRPRFKEAHLGDWFLLAPMWIAIASGRFTLFSTLKVGLVLISRHDVPRSFVFKSEAELRQERTLSTFTFYNSINIALPVDATRFRFIDILPIRVCNL